MEKGLSDLEPKEKAVIIRTLKTGLFEGGMGNRTAHVYAHETIRKESGG